MSARYCARSTHATVAGLRVENYRTRLRRADAPGQQEERAIIAVLSGRSDNTKVFGRCRAPCHGGPFVRRISLSLPPRPCGWRFIPRSPSNCGDDKTYRRSDARSGVDVVAAVRPRSTAIHRLALATLADGSGVACCVDARNVAPTYTLYDLVDSLRRLWRLRVARAFTVYQHHALE